MFNFFYISLISSYRLNLSGTVSLISLHLVIPYYVLLVAIWWGPALFSWMDTHSVCPTVMCKITVGSTTAAYAPIHDGNWISCRYIRVLHSPGVWHVSLHNNAYASFASLTAFAAPVWTTVAGCFAHDPQAPARLLVSTSESNLVARLPVALQRHCRLCWRDVFPHLQWWDWTSLSALCEM